MKTYSGTVPLVALTLVLLAVAPVAYASTLTVTLNPATKTATVSSTSTTKMTLTYPAGSSLSKALSNYSSSVSWTGTYESQSQGVFEPLQESLDQYVPSIHVLSMNVTYSLQGKGNTTALVVTKQTVITALISGLFSVSNGTVTANLHWKAYRVSGQFMLDLGGNSIDINQVGSAWGAQLSNHPLILRGIVGLFGGSGLWTSSTLDFSALNSSLSTWMKNYDSSTNTTTFSKTVSGHSSLKATEDFNGQNYTLSVVSDPSAQVVVPGYAVASGDNVFLQAAPVQGSADLLVLLAVVVVAVACGALYLGLRSRKPTHSGVETGAVSAQGVDK